MQAKDDEAAPVIPPNEETSLVNYVVNNIIDGVSTGRYAHGQRLIAADLAEEYGVSRAPVREALHVLAGEGVVMLTQNRGAKIRRLSAKQLFDFLEFTESICALGVRLASQRMGEDDNRARMEKRFADIGEAWTRRHGRDFVTALYLYHVELNEISGNQFVDFFYRRPYIRFYTILLSDLVPGVEWEQYYQNYKRIHETILEGDVHASVATFVSHIRWVLDLIREPS